MSSRIEQLIDEIEDSDISGKYALIIFALTEKLQKLIEENEQHTLYYDIELPLIKVLASMQILGFTLDSDELKKFGQSLALRINELEKEIYAEAGEEFNINSPKQLGVILFDKLGLKGGKKTKSGYSTKADILPSIIGNPISCIFSRKMI